MNKNPVKDQIVSSGDEVKEPASKSSSGRTPTRMQPETGQQTGRMPFSHGDTKANGRKTITTGKKP